MTRHPLPLDALPEHDARLPVPSPRVKTLWYRSHHFFRRPPRAHAHAPKRPHPPPHPAKPAAPRPNRQPRRPPRRPHPPPPNPFHGNVTNRQPKTSPRPKPQLPRPCKIPQKTLNAGNSNADRPAAGVASVSSAIRQARVSGARWRRMSRATPSTGRDRGRISFRCGGPEAGQALNGRQLAAPARAPTSRRRLGGSFSVRRRASSDRLKP